MEKLSKFLSLLLRHQPEKIGLVLDENGWADVAELIHKMNQAGQAIDLSTLEKLVETNNKKRFSFNEERLKIRANQGHSIQVDVELKETEPPDVLYHGTAERFLDAIRKTGLQKMERQQVHLSQDKETALLVGKRHGKPAILEIAAGEMRKQGYRFFISENNVWLTEQVPIIFIKETYS